MHINIWTSKRHDRCHLHREVQSNLIIYLIQPLHLLIQVSKHLYNYPFFLFLQASRLLRFSLSSTLAIFITLLKPRKTESENKIEAKIQWTVWRMQSQVKQPAWACKTEWAL